MEIFRLTKNLFVKYGLDPDQFIFRRPFNKKGLLMLFLLCLSIASYSLYILLIANTFAEYANGIYMTIAVILGCYVYVACVWYRRAYLMHMECLEKAINERLNNPSSKSIYTTYNRYVDTFCKWFYIGIVKIAPMGSMSPFLIISYFSYYITDLDQNSFILPFPMWFPFDWKNPSGYLVSICVEVFLITCAAITGVLATNFGFGISLIVIAMAKDVEVNLSSISDRAKSHPNKSQLVIDFKDFIRHYSDTKQLGFEFSEIFKPITAGILSVNVLLICAALPMIQIILSQGLRDSMDLPIILIQVAGAFFFLIVACELGERITMAYDGIEHKMLQMSWYNLPAKLQNILPLVISIAQQEVTMDGIGSVVASRETFKRIFKGGFSYFISARQLY